MGEQIKELREKADMLDGITDVNISTPWVHAKLTPMLREAADTIESLRERLQDAALGSGECEFDVVEERIPGKRRRANICECSNCGYRCAYGFIVDERFEHCPGCGFKIGKAVK